MRNAFRDHLTLRIKKNKNLFLLVGDIGFGVFEKFAKYNKNNYLNIGICEQNMIGVSSGLSMIGFVPIVYTIIPFLTMRPFEQIRVDLAMHKRKVLLVGVGGGLSYGNLGPTHHSIEDIAIISSLPNFRVFVPSDPSDSKKSFDQALKYNGPSYIRLGKNGEPDLKKNVVEKISNKLFVFNKRISQSSGLIITYGPITNECIVAAKKLLSLNIKVSVISFFNIKPLPKELINIAKKFNKIIFVEEHNTYHCVGTNFSSEILNIGFKGQLKLIGINDKFTSKVGSREFLLKSHKIDSNSLFKKASIFFNE